MGKNKWFNETDEGQPRSYRKEGASNQKRNSSVPAFYRPAKQSNYGNKANYLEYLWVHFKRKWTSLRFIGRSFTLPFFSKANMAKFAFLAIATFYLFGDDIHISASLAQSDAKIDWNKEVPLAVANDSKKTARNVKPSNSVKKKASKSEAAPVHVETLKGNQSLNYIQKFSGIARADMKKYGIPASISLAQGLIESRAGTSKLAVNNNNHFGMKCFSRNCRKGHCTNFTDDTHKDFFLKFQNANQSWSAHSKLISTGRYAKLKKYGRDYRRWAIGLKSVGYATDRSYAQKLINVIERYNLHQYDR
jgi:flagellum-specific peptidoglycan hydrolase FlgJ